MATTAKRTTSPVTDDEGIDLSDAPEVDLSKARRGPSRHAGLQLELPLAGARAAAGKTQADVSAWSGIDQGDVSKLEAREDLGSVELGTLRRYVEALGGDLEIVAVLRNGARVQLSGALDGRKLAKSLREARERAGLTTKQLADKLGMIEHVIHRYESGRHEPSPAYCRRVWGIGSGRDA